MGKQEEQSGHSRGRAKYDPEMVARLLLAADGNLSEVARKLECSRTTIYRYVEEFDICKEAREDSREEFVDLAESELRKRVRAGDTSAIRFVLRCWGGKRGWREKQEVDITSKGDKVNQSSVILIPDNGLVQDGDE